MFLPGVIVGVILTALVVHVDRCLFGPPPVPRSLDRLKRELWFREGAILDALEADNDRRV